MKDHHGGAREKHSARQAGPLPVAADGKKRAEEALAAAEREVVKTEAADAEKVDQEKEIEEAAAFVLFQAREADPAVKESIVDDKDLGEDNEIVLEDKKQDEAAAATKKKREEALQSSYMTQKKAKRMKIRKRK